jgi:hypothetical protein
VRWPGLAAEQKTPPALSREAMNIDIQTSTHSDLPPRHPGAGLDNAWLRLTGRQPVA